MSDRDSLGASLSAAPDDRGTRLAWADWLQENGDPERGALLALLARPPESLTRGERRELSRLRVRVVWCDPAAVAPALRLLADATNGTLRAAAVADLLPLIPPDHPALFGLRRLAARYAEWAADHELRLAVWGHSTGYLVRPYRDGTGAWVVDGGMGQQWPGAWSCWPDAALWGLSRRGVQRTFHGVSLDLRAAPTEEGL